VIEQVPVRNHIEPFAVFFTTPPPFFDRSPL
jgi:hypothetical protein